ncbi:glucose dehydrogenase [FAD, quinone]-like [Cherax quadricarinatus]
MYTIRDGVRSSTSEAYLRPASSRPNLHILHSATVLQVVFDEHKRASGVKLEHKGKVMTIGARKEVVLSAGAIRSPHLLLVSGVGPQDHLQRHEVEIVADVPGVGQNLHDHVCVHGLSWTTRKGVTSSTLWNTLNFASIKQYVNNRGGGLGDTLAGVHDAWVKVSNEGDPLWPDIQLLFTPVSHAFDFGIFTPGIHGADQIRWKGYMQEIYGMDGFGMRPILLRPKSRGTITLKSGDPRQLPKIDPNYLHHPDDLQTLADG